MKRIFCIVLVLYLLMFTWPGKVRADVAPPEVAPGVNPGPGNEPTQVRMLAETVTLTVSEELAEYQTMLAKTEAVFTMRNLGAEQEKMPVRFPLSFFDESYQFAELEGIEVLVDGKGVETRREIQPFTAQAGSAPEPVPWAVFDVTFPPEQDVIIEVSYMVQGFGYYPYEMFKYVLETGAGWKDTIGSAEIIVRLPYEANSKNAMLEPSTLLMKSTPGGVIQGNEIRWTFENLEPSSENNIEVVLLGPPLWRTLQQEMQAVAQNASDAEAWRRLAKTYQEVITIGKGALRDDPAGREMYALSKNAYQNCFALNPDNSLCHAGYADLLWSYYYFDIYWLGKTDTERILPTVLTELQTALILDPNNQDAKDSLRGISNAIPEAVTLEGDNFVLLGLTATTIPPRPHVEEVAETPPPTPKPNPTQPATPAPTESAPQPNARSPLCGSAALLLPLFGIVWLVRRKPSAPVRSL